MANSPSSVMLKKFSLLLVFVSELGVVLDDELTAA